MMISDKQKQVILHFLKQLETVLLEKKDQKLNPFFVDFFNREELITILEYTYFDQDLEAHQIDECNKIELLELIGSDYFILSGLIQILEMEIESKTE
ncbi:hypothetical protein [Yeosuana marina]|uniref:hypothetical protein n=1 Tax=Yeosuana marina TaxID=1565536 RepID=UPI0030C83744